MEFTDLLNDPWVATGISLLVDLVVVTVAFRIGHAVLRRLTRSRPIMTLMVDAIVGLGRDLARHPGRSAIRT